MRINFRVISVCFFMLTLWETGNSKDINNTNLDVDNLYCKDCNVLFLNIDLLRADHIGLLNIESPFTPNIDKFFKNSIIFEDVSSVSGVTAISNTSTLMSRDGVFIYTLLQRTYVDKPPQLPHKYLKMFSTMPTIAEVLHKNDYKTININHGWYAGKQMLLDRGIDLYWGSGEVGSTSNIPAIVLKKTTEILLEKTKKKEKFFLLVRSEDLRSLPYRYPSNRKRITNNNIHYRKVNEKQYDIYYQTTPDGELTIKFPNNARIKWMKNDEFEVYRSLSQRLYAQQLKFIDEELGKLFSYIESSSLLTNTIIVLYANHGDGLYDNGVPNHGVSYQSSISVPLLIRHPNIEHPIRVENPISLIDLVPTIYQMIDLTPPDNTDGVSLTNTIKGKKYERPYLFGIDKESKYIRDGNMKLIVWIDRTMELYDLGIDPHEENNIIEDNSKLAHKLYSLMALHEVEQLGKALEILSTETK